MRAEAPAAQAAFTRDSPLNVSEAPTTSSSWMVKVAPFAFPPSAMVIGALPSSRTFFSFPLDWNASHCPSGEKCG